VRMVASWDRGPFCHKPQPWACNRCLIKIVLNEGRTGMTLAAKYEEHSRKELTNCEVDGPAIQCIGVLEPGGLNCLSHCRAGPRG
jgi:hypothetical protein